MTPPRQPERGYRRGRCERPATLVTWRSLRLRASGLVGRGRPRTTKPWLQTTRSRRIVTWVHRSSTSFIIPVGPRLTAILSIIAASVPIRAPKQSLWRLRSRAVLRRNVHARADAAAALRQSIRRAGLHGHGPVRGAPPARGPFLLAARHHL